MTDSRLNVSNRWLLPEGVDEFLPPQAIQLERLRRDLLDLFSSWGYDLVIPPLMEYLESLLVGVGNDLELETFKLIDQSTGRLMGVRADMTPQVARIDAHRLKLDSPVRLCYLDTVLHTRQEGFASSRTPLQLGAELYGHAGLESDSEMLQLMVAALRITNIENFHIDLGHVGIFRSLSKLAQLSEEQEAVLFDALQRKAKPEIESYLSTLNIDSSACAMLVSLVELSGGIEMLDEAESCLAKSGAEVQAALESLRKIARMATSRMNGVPLHFDLAELRGYRYQSGLVFAAFVPGFGQEIARGGRYDEVGRLFGRARPATGFSADLKTLMTLSAEVAGANPRAIHAPSSECERLQGFIQKLREQGERVINELPGQQGGMTALGCNRQIEKQNGNWVVVDI